MKPVFRPSSADKWMNCPASAILEADEPETSSAYAREGIWAHSVLQEGLYHPERPISGILSRHEAKYRDLATPENRQDILEVVQEVRQFCSRPGVVVSPEQFVSFKTQLYDIYGTADVVIWVPESRTLVVGDLKFGVGVGVRAENNRQLQCYLLGAWELYPEARNFIGVIWQPRYRDEDYHRSVWKLDHGSMKRAQGDVWVAADRADAEAPIPGAWCKRCKAAWKCPAVTGRAASLGRETPALGPGTIAPKIIQEWMPKLPAIRKLCDTIEQNAVEVLSRNPQAIKGYGLVQGKGHRQWLDVTIAEQTLKLMLENDTLYESPKLKSPAQIDKLLKGEDKQVLENLTTRPDTKPRLVPNLDSSPKSLFTDLTNHKDSKQ